MKKLPLIILALAVVIAVIFTQPRIKQLFLGYFQQNRLAAPASVLGVFTKNIKQKASNSIQNESNSIKTETKNSLQKVVQDTTNAVTTFVETKTQSALDSAFNNDNPQIVTTNDTPTHIINFLSDNNQSITIRKGNKFILAVKNVPAHFCLFISTSKFTLQDNVNLAITIKNTGSYPLRFDYCDTKQSQFGSIVVE
ncbi:MAG: hypothetical protein NUV65_06275 [Candidatus Roizmanbacteria bacterium]|nr:hypothetical protein [Candidatus Roizmanbacteria bacterium]